MTYIKNMAFKPFGNVAVSALTTTLDVQWCRILHEHFHVSKRMPGVCSHLHKEGDVIVLVFA